MSRGIKKKYDVRIPVGDFIYNEVSISKLINNMMYGGEKQKSAGIVYKAIDLAVKTLAPTTPEADAVNLVKTAIANVSVTKLAVRRVLKGRSLMIPKEINQTQSTSYSIKTIIAAARTFRKSKGIPMFSALSETLINAYNNEGDVISRKKAISDAAEVNKHYKI